MAVRGYYEKKASKLKQCALGAILEFKETLFKHERSEGADEGGLREPHSCKKSIQTYVLEY